ncbi:MAG TPA: BadF/BadG/BcrA/BcrD ATPase family protein [Terriglobia bacterium]|nr:BadF/BadG/BcrA/BcrD ATPase family protein [Terriglobia bacterium]
MRYYLGIDGGGTQTTAWLADGRRRVIARAQAGPSNPAKVGMAGAQAEIERALKGCLLHAGAARRSLAAVCAGVAGVDRAGVHDPLLRWLEESVPAAHHAVTTDAAIALEAAFGEKPGILVISGTGSIAYGRNPAGVIMRCGGWGSVFDDAGSGYDVGRKAVTGALWDFDGRGRHTRLGSLLCTALKLKVITGVVELAPQPHEVAALISVVFRAARQGDRVARMLCHEAGGALADLASALHRRLSPGTAKLPVVCAGGVFRSSVLVRRSFAVHLRAKIPQARITLLRRQPVEGALALARRLDSEA